MANYTVISHDGFARTSIVRQKIRTSRVCANCGWNTKGYQYEYGTLPDDRLDGRPNWESKVFCSKQCHDQFWGS